MSQTIDGARLTLLLNDLRLPAIKQGWAAFAERADGCVPARGVRAVGKWPAGATVQSLAQAGHLPTAVVIADLR
jgi:hypothetical protein